MAMMFRQEHSGRVESNEITFYLDVELKKHAWHPYMNALEAEALLSGHPTFTYLTRPSDLGRGFALSFVNPKGHIEHHYFTLINPKYGIFRNAHPSHVGKLEKVIRDMMDCGICEEQPLV